MNTDLTCALEAPRASRTRAAEVPLAQLMVDVYESAPSDMQNHLLAELVGGTYKTAPPSMRRRLLAHLLQPLGMLSLAVVANGIFLKIRYRNEWPNMQVGLDDLPGVGVDDVVALAEQAQRVGLDALDGLAQLLMTSPAMTGSAVAAVLVTLLVRRAQMRRAEDEAGEGFSVA